MGVSHDHISYQLGMFGKIFKIQLNNHVSNKLYAIQMGLDKPILLHKQYMKLMMN
jgi:hypothetical protein